MDSIFKVGECVCLKHGKSPEMTVQSVDFSPLENCNDIVCTWYDEKHGKGVTQIFKEQVLKHCIDNA